MEAINIQDVWQIYRIQFEEGSRTIWDNFCALKGITFRVAKGEIVGIIGENGAGKSTLLKIIAGMLPADEGTVTVSGRVCGLLELGAGFEMELTGRENIYLQASLFGLSRRDAEEKMEAIIEFADLGRFINAPVKYYSQGMFVRLAFSIAIHMNPDILLIDDTLAVGDEFFQKKCLQKIFELKETGKTIIIVTHDMMTLRKLTSRILLMKEGRILKDAEAEGVIALYTQMVGPKGAVAELCQDSFRVIFNSGSLFINAADTLLTPESGLYTQFLIEGKWYSSLQAQWDIQRPDETRLIARGYFHEYTLSQIWQLHLTAAKQLTIDIILERERPITIAEGLITVLLDNRYSRWFTPQDKGSFGTITDRDRDWRPLLGNTLVRKCIGAYGIKTDTYTFPSVIFEQFKAPVVHYCQVINTDHFTGLRALQYSTKNLASHAAVSRNRFTYFSGKLQIDCPDIQIYLDTIKEERTLTSDALELIFNKGTLSLSHSAQPLTKASNILMLSKINGRFYSSDQAQWQVKKCNDGELVARGRWRDAPFLLLWRIVMAKGGFFEWEAWLQNQETIEVTEQFIRCMFSEKYTSFENSYARGMFPQDFMEYETDMLQRCIPRGDVTFRSQSIASALTFSFSEKLNNFAKIFNSEISTRARVLYIGRVEPESATTFTRGKHLFFKIKGTVAAHTSESTTGENARLGAGPLMFDFSKGRGSIFWKGKELTKRLGLYTSVKYRGRWYDSHTQAVWHIQQKNQSIEATGNWIHLPLLQHWQVSLHERNALSVIIEMILREALPFERIQTNLMLSEHYTRWMLNGEKGDFTHFKKDLDDDWQLVRAGRSAGENGSCIGVFCAAHDTEQLPSVQLISVAHALSDAFNIINSDMYHRSRILQSSKSKNIHLEAGSYTYYRGRVVITE